MYVCCPSPKYQSDPTRCYVRGCISQAIGICTKKSHFRFDSKYYDQIDGVVKVSHCAMC